MSHASVVHSDLEPWWDVWLPARYHERRAAGDGIATLLAHDSSGDALAIAARATAALGMRRAALVLAADALDRGGNEAEFLAIHTDARGEYWAGRRIAGEQRNGRRADAACDLAARLVNARRPDDAMRAIERALEIQPDHGEARTWRRRTHDTRGRARIRHASMPLPEHGWISDVRMRRRVLGLAHPDWAPPHRALGRLQDMGIHERWFASEAELAVLPVVHPWVALEVAADELRECAIDGADPRLDFLAHRVWEEAQCAGWKLEAATLIAQCAVAYPRDIQRAASVCAEVGILDAWETRLRRACRRPEVLALVPHQAWDRPPSDTVPE